MASSYSKLSSLREKLSNLKVTEVNSFLNDQIKEKLQKAIQAKLTSFPKPAVSSSGAGAMFSEVKSTTTKFEIDSMRLSRWAYYNYGRQIYFIKMSLSFVKTRLLLMRCILI